MTEIPGVTCNPFEGPQKPGSMGPIGRHPDPARPWAECRVVDDDGRDVGVDEVGELIVKTPIIMQGYFRDPEQTRAAFRDGWFLTGDLVRRDADGYFYLRVAQEGHHPPPRREHRRRRTRPGDRRASRRATRSAAIAGAGGTRRGRNPGGGRAPKPGATIAAAESRSGAASGSRRRRCRATWLSSTNCRTRPVR